MNWVGSIVGWLDLRLHEMLVHCGIKMVGLKLWLVKVENSLVGQNTGSN